MRAGVSLPPSGAPLQRESPRPAPGSPRGALRALSPSGTEPSVSSCKRPPRRFATLPSKTIEKWLSAAGIKPPHGGLGVASASGPLPSVRYLATSALRYTETTRIQGMMNDTTPRMSQSCANSGFSR